MKVIKIGIIGVGAVAQVAHLPAWRKIKFVEIGAAADSDEEKLERFSSRHEISRRFTDYRDMLRLPELDAVDICVPTNLHHQVVIDALNAGKHVLVEKPIAKNFEEAQEIVEAVRTNNRKLMVATNVRFRDDFLFLKNLIDANELGDVYSCHLSWLHKKESPHELQKLSDPEVSGGGVLMDLGVQAIDVGIWLLGNAAVETVSTVTFNRSLGLDVEDSAFAFMRLAGGKAFTLRVSWSFLSDKDYLHTNVLGTAGSASINPFRINKEMQGNLMNLTPQQNYSPTNLYKKSYINEIAHFANCIVYGGNMVSTADVHLERMRILKAMYRSAGEGREVTLE